MTGRIWDEPAVRQAVQAAAAVALAMGCGALLSGQRWYWAVIAAFIVSIGVGSRGEVLVKALQRLAGTLGGIVVGIVLAAAVAGQTDLVFALVLVCVFFAFYAFQAAYGVMIFCITVMLALLYGLLGRFGVGFLELRFAETGVGAAAGVLVSMTVLPIRQHDLFRDAARDFLDALARTVRAMLGEGGNAGEVSREMQVKAQAVRDTVGSLKRGWAPLAPMRYRHAVRAVRGCAYLTRELVLRGGPAPGEAEAILAAVEAARSAAGRARPEPGMTVAGLSDPADAVAPRSEDALVAALLEALDDLGRRLSAT
ncbi:MAG TPA: FUSC family protein [Hyphomicrobiales bacterium]|nr:FUSC family protein [Hyphomicrobiales bacterium]